MQRDLDSDNLQSGLDRMRILHLTPYKIILQQPIRGRSDPAQLRFKPIQLLRKLGSECACFLERLLSRNTAL
jgi:hypothetical protein